MTTDTIVARIVADKRVEVERRKIDEPHGRASIQTVRGFGYRLVDDQL